MSSTELLSPPTATGTLSPQHAISVDVEDYFMVLNFRKRIAADEWQGFPSRVVANTQRILDLFERAGVRGTFFTLGCVAEAHPDLVREIAARGHEVEAVEPFTWVVGGMHGIRRDPASGALEGGADPRRDGYAATP